MHEYVLHNTVDIFDNEMTTLPIKDDTSEPPMQEWKFSGVASKSKNYNIFNERLYSHFSTLIYQTIVFMHIIQPIITKNVIAMHWKYRSEKKRKRHMLWNIEIG